MQYLHSCLFFSSSHNHWKVMTLGLFHRFYSSTYSIAPAAHFSFTNSPSCSRSLLYTSRIFSSCLSVCLSLAASSSNLSVQIQLPSLPETHIHHWRGNKLFQDRQTVLFGSPLFVFFSLSHPLSPTNRWGILMKSALPVPICVRNEFHHF